MIGVLLIGVVALACGILLSAAGWFFRVEEEGDGESLEDLLPGTQCGQCGFAGCKQAAAAIKSGSAPINICPPGGRGLVLDLAAALGVEVPDADGMVEDEGPLVATVEEAFCIGCMKCAKACPTDAIVGASRQIHTVLTDLCTSCKKCVDVCPTEGVTMVGQAPEIDAWQWPLPVSQGESTNTGEPGSRPD